MNELVKKTTDLAGEIVDSVSWFLKRMEAPGRAIRREDAIGQTAEVSVELQPGATGQILVLLGGTLQNYTARSVSKTALPKGTIVRITHIGNDVMHVEPITGHESDI